MFNKPVRFVFTKHATQKLRLKESKTFKINQSKLENIINFGYMVALPSGVIRAVGKFDLTHSLCVVYRLESDDIIRIITFFPTEKGRYESKIL